MFNIYGILIWVSQKPQKIEKNSLCKSPPNPFKWIFSPAQRGFFKNRAGDLLPALRFLGGLCNFCNYTFFNHNGMLKSDIFYRFENYWILPKSKQLKKSTKTKNYVTNYARYNYTIIQTLYKFLTTKKWL